MRVKVTSPWRLVCLDSGQSRRRDAGMRQGDLGSVLLLPPYSVLLLFDVGNLIPDLFREEQLYSVGFLITLRSVVEAF